MNDIPDKILIRNVKRDGCNESFIELCRRYENVFYKMCQKFTPALINAGLSPQDIFNEKNIIIFNCIKTYKAKKGSKLSTWICNYARYLCLNSINARKCLITVDSEELRDLMDASGNNEQVEKIKVKENYEYLTKLISQIKDERIPKIIQLRHLSDKKREWKYIAKKLNISSQTVINLHERGMNILRRKLQSKEFADVI
jgi:RNA polymerase sigma factor (sigma-70 family)